MGKFTKNICGKKVGSHRLQNGAARALQLHAEDKAISEELGDREGVARACGNLGTCYDSTGQYAQALELHAEFKAYVCSASRVQRSPLAPGCQHHPQGTCRLGREQKLPCGQQTSTHASTAFSSMAPVHAFASTTAGVSAYARVCSKFAMAETGRLARSDWRCGTVGFRRGPVGSGRSIERTKEMWRWNWRRRRRCAAGSCFKRPGCCRCLLAPVAIFATGRHTCKCQTHVIPYIYIYIYIYISPQSLYNKNKI